MNLYVRPARQDNRLIEELTAPVRSGLKFLDSRKPPLHGLVVDATVAAGSEDFRKTAEAAGIPLLIDPLTTLLQDEQAPDNPWAQLPFAHPEVAPVETLSSGAVQDELIDRSIRFQLDHGASALVAPYLFAKSADDPAWRAQLNMNKRLAAYLAQEGITVPVIPVLAGALRTFGPTATWTRGVDAFLSSLAGMNVRTLGLALSASRSSKGDNPDRLGSYLATVRHLANVTPVLAWRQGQYGLATLAAGATGYQTAARSDDRCDFGEFSRNRRPSENPTSFVTQKRIFLAPFGRSVSGKAAQALVDSRHMRGRLACMDSNCCTNGKTDMFENWRQHNLRARARQIDELAAMPDAAWRLNFVARQAEHAAADARTANQVLADAGIPERIPEASFRSLAKVADAMRADAAGRTSA